jgi:hypothetical protein
VLSLSLCFVSSGQIKLITPNKIDRSGNTSEMASYFGTTRTLILSILDPLSEVLSCIKQSVERPSEVSSFVVTVKYVVFLKPVEKVVPCTHRAIAETLAPSDIPVTYLIWPKKKERQPRVLPNLI